MQALFFLMSQSPVRTTVHQVPHLPIWDVSAKFIQLSLSFLHHRRNLDKLLDAREKQWVVSGDFTSINGPPKCHFPSWQCTSSFPCIYGHKIDPIVSTFPPTLQIWLSRSICSKRALRNWMAILRGWINPIFRKGSLSKLSQRNY